jgi:phage gp46-like protein
MIRESLLWLVNDGLALAVDCAAERNGKSRIDYQVTITRPAGSPVILKEVWGVI